MFKVILQYLLPQHALSHFFGKIAGVRNQTFKNWLIKRFIKYFHVNMDEAQESDINAYPDFNHFFIRKLKSALRPIVTGANQIASPVDGTISQFGRIQTGRLFQAKGSDYSLHDLLGVDRHLPTAFDAGSYITLYLAPKDYHRVHMPYPGVLREMRYIPGKLFSVQTEVVNRVDNLFTRNERVIACFDTAMGPMVIVLVGAMIVGSIETIWHGVVNQQGDRGIKQWHYNDPDAIYLAKGEELGHFKLGSTVIVLFSQERQINWANQLRESSQIKYGQLLANHT